MIDMLVKLYQLPPLEPEIAAMTAAGITIRRAIAPEKHFVAPWVGQEFSAFWQSETEIAFAHVPIKCWIAIDNKQVIGFACYDISAKGFFGPTGVDTSARGRGVGKALLLTCLHAMRFDGYAYAIIGGVGPAEFYQKVVGATIIEGSEHAVYEGLLRKLPDRKNSKTD